MRSRIKALIVPVIIALALAGVFAYSSRNPAQGTQCIQTVRSGSIEVEWLEGFDSIASMRAAASVVVVGEVISSQAALEGRLHKVIYTDHTVSVESPLKGNPGATVVVYQLGGVWCGARMEVRDDPLMAVGDRLVLFLRLDSDTGEHYVLRGPQGRFVVRDHLVYSLNALYPERDIELPWRIAGLPEADFLATLR